MSRVRARFLKDSVTRWRMPAYDPNDIYASKWGTPITLKCNFMNGGSIQRDQDGSDFQPSTTYRCKLGDVITGDRVVLGISVATEPPNNAETVRSKNTGTTLVGSADMTFYTG
jgi:hypothetical protein